MTTISAKIENEDKSSFESILTSIGLNVSTAINAFVKVIIPREKHHQIQI